MKIFTLTKLGRMLLLLAAAVVLSVGLMGCPQTPDEPDDPVGTGGSSFKDSRDGKTYRTVVVGGKTWMAENLNYVSGDSWCNEGSPDSCAKYGRLYFWSRAWSACPSGWRLPFSDEWDSLGKSVGGTKSSDDAVEYDWLGAGKKLKFGAGWLDDGNGTDIYGFSALPGGSVNNDGVFFDVGKYGVWWTASEVNESEAFYWIMWYNNDGIGKRIYRKDDGRSVRCVKDN